MSIEIKEEREQKLFPQLQFEDPKKASDQLALTQAAYTDTLNSYHKLQYDYRKLQEENVNLRTENASRNKDNITHEEYLAENISNHYITVPKKTFLDIWPLMADLFVKEQFYIVVDKEFKYVRAFTDDEIEKAEKQQEQP